MTALTDRFTADMQFAEAHLPQVVTIGGTDYAAVVTDVARGEGLAVEGIFPAAAIVVTMRTAVLAAPVISTLLTYNGAQFRVLAVKDCADEVSYELTCDAVHK